MSDNLYTTEELKAMTPEEFSAARDRGYTKPTAIPAVNTTGRRVDVVEVGPSLASPPQDPYAVTTWGQTEFDFRVPSGQLCRMKKLLPEDLIGDDILDQITRLPGFAQDLVDKAEGKPPVGGDEVNTRDVKSLLELLEKLIPMVVVKPHVVRSDTPEAEVPTGAIRIKEIELHDRIAIMERAMQGVNKMDNFREES